jgi:hypothetical protein
MKYIITEQQQENLIYDYLNKYIESGCVKIKKSGRYMSVDVESPSYFEWNGFDKSDAAKIKIFLKKNSFQYAFGDYIKEF